MPDTILRDDDNNIDDVTIEDIKLFRLEVQSDKSIWLKLYFVDPDRPAFELNIGSKGKIKIYEV